MLARVTVPSSRSPHPGLLLLEAQSPSIAVPPNYTRLLDLPDEPSLSLEKRHQKAPAGIETSQEPRLRAKEKTPSVSQDPRLYPLTPYRLSHISECC